MKNKMFETTFTCDHMDMEQGHLINYFHHILIRHGGAISKGFLNDEYSILFTKQTYDRVKYDWEQVNMESKLIDSILEAMKEATYEI